MVDAIEIVRQVLLTTTAVTSLLGSNAGGSVYGGADMPEGWDATLGPAIQVYLAAGSAHTEILVETMPEVRVRVWTQVNDYELCHRVSRACFDALHGINMKRIDGVGMILSCLCSLTPQDITDPDDDTPTVLTSYQLDLVP